MYTFMCVQNLRVVFLLTPSMLRKIQTQAGWPSQLAREMTEMALRAVHVQDEDTPARITYS